MRVALFVILFVPVCSRIALSQGPSKAENDITSVTIYGVSFDLIPEPGIIGFDFIDYVNEKKQSGSRYVEVTETKDKWKLAEIFAEYQTIARRADTTQKSTAWSFRFLIVLKSDDRLVGAIWIETLNSDFKVYVNGFEARIFSGELRSVLSEVKHKDIRQPIKKWIRKAKYDR